jgi:hypothetical protein
MKKLILALLLSVISLSTFAQTQKEDVVYLKNGSVVRGEIVEQIPNQTIKIEIQGGSIFVYQISEIEKMTREEPKNTGKQRNASSLTLSTGFFGKVNFQGGGIDAGIGLNVIGGYRFNDYLSLGLGTGYNQYINSLFSYYYNGLSYNWNYYHGGFIPLYVDFKVNMTKTKFSPYWQMDAGYGFSVNRFGKGGYMLGSSVGCDYKLDNRHIISLGFNWLMQNTTYTPYYYTQRYCLQTVGVNLGFTF